jgi:hypothetical protein
MTDEIKLTEQDIEDLFEAEDSEDSTFAEVAAAADDSQSIDKKYAESQLRIVRSTIDFPLNTLRVSLADDDYINMAPSYQRRARWTASKRSQLIESLLMNIPVPPIFLFENEYNRYEVMDGRQRLEAIRDYLNDGFPLRSLEYWKELQGRRFSKLPETLQRGLLRRTLTAFVLLAETRGTLDNSFDVRMALFKRLNTGGINLNAQELRNALYPGPFNKLLAALARSNLFTLVWQIPPYTEGEEDNPPQKLVRNPLYKTMADCQLVLRFFAVREAYVDERIHSLGDMLDSCMRRHAGDGEPELHELEVLFTTTLKQLYDLFGDSTFVLSNSGKLSTPLYEALMVGRSLLPDHDASTDSDSVIEKLNNIVRQESDDYDLLINRANTAESMRNRIGLAMNVLKA